MTAVYVDSSALLKRVFVESDSGDLRAILRERSARGDLLVTSELTWIEVSRAILRAGIADPTERVRDACSGIARRELDSAVLRRGERIGPVQLRSLDAIHLAAAVTVGATELITFDQRLASAARTLGLVALP